MTDIDGAFSFGVRTGRLVVCVVAAALWLAVCSSATFTFYQLGNEIEDCPWRADGQAVTVEGNFPSLRATCVYRRADGSVSRESDYAPQMVTLAFGLVIGVVPAAVFIRAGIGWPLLRRRRASDRAAASGPDG